MNAMRIAIGGILAAGVTLGLFLLMHTLIEMADKSIDESDTRKITDITMPEIKIEAQVKEVKPDKPDEPEEPPPDLPTPQMDNIEVDTGALNLSAPTGADVNIGLGGGLGASDGEYLPIVKVAPIYPRRATSRGIEGYCIVEYTVTKSGTTRDIRPVDCQPSGVFDSASVKAAEKFKYKPRVVDGEPIEVAGVQNKFTYTLEK